MTGGRGCWRPSAVGMLCAAAAAPGLPVRAQTPSLTDLGLPPVGTAAYARGVSANGSVVVGTYSQLQGPPSRAFRWTSAGGMQDLFPMNPARNTVANGVSSGGEYIAGGVNAFLWSAQGTRELGVPAGADTSVASAERRRRRGVRKYRRTGPLALDGDCRL